MVQSIQEIKSWKYKGNETHLNIKAPLSLAFISFHSTNAFYKYIGVIIT